jgi:outer membrane protein assembly factor BamB
MRDNSWSAAWGLGVMLACGTSLFAGDWTRFRGPNGSGVSAESAPLPTTWSPTEHLLWKVTLPGPGSSSPVITGGKVFVTCWSGYATERGNAGRMEDLRRNLVCLDMKSGKTLWSQEVAATLPEDEYRGMFAENGYASHTPVTDGERVYVFFGKTGALAFDLNGKKLWQRSIGKESDPRGWGSAASPILYKDLLIVTATAESEALVALNKQTGEQVWRQEARGFAGTWGTPVLVETNGRTDLVIGVPNEIWAFNPENGKLAWFCETSPSDSYCASVVTDNGIVYALENRGGQTTAVRAGGSDDVTSSRVLWRGRDNARITSPVIYDGRIYLFSGGVATCLDERTGERVYQARFGSGGGGGGGGMSRSEGSPPERGEQFGGPGGPQGGPGGRGPGGRGGGGGRGGMGGQNYASPILADGKLYFITRAGEMHVIKPGAQFEELAVNKVTTETEDFSATPAVADGRLLIRSSKHLYCVGNP